MRINWIGLIIAAIVIVLLRYAWYAHFGGADWGHLAHQTIADIQANHKAAGLALANALVLSFGLAWLTGSAGSPSLGGGLGAGLLAGLLFGGTTVAASYIWGGAPVKTLLIDAGYLVVAYAIGGALIGATTRRRRARSTVFDMAAPAAAGAAVIAAEDDHGHGGHGDHGHGGHH